MNYPHRKSKGQIMSMQERSYRLYQQRLQYAMYMAHLNARRQPKPQPKPRSTKNALLIGIVYKGTNHELYGCINDVNAVKTRLDSNGFQCQMLTDTTPLKPTRINMLNSIKALLSNAVAGDQLFLFYSGHGSYVRDRNGDEADGNDEALVSLDMQGIVDDELKTLLLQHLKKDVTLVAMFDSCNSGSVLDLKYQYMVGGAERIAENYLETAGKVYMISGCMDTQTSDDAFIENKSQGAMTWSLLESLKTTQPTWRQLLQSMRDLLKTNGHEQIPQFSSGTAVDIDSAVFI
jgi:hypothetical protein